MRHAVLALVCLGLLAACSSGSTSPVTPRTPVQKIESDVVEPLSATYRAVFDCTAQFSVSSSPLPITVDGTLTIRNTGDTVEYAVDPSREGSVLQYTLVLNIPAIVRSQAPELPATITAIAREYIQVDVDGSWLSLGGELEDPTTTPIEVYRSWWGQPILNQEPLLELGQVITVPETEVLSEDLMQVLATRQSRRTVGAASEVLNTGLGSLETYPVVVVETLIGDGGQGAPTLVTYRRWERPDMGLIGLYAEDYEVEYDDNGTITTIVLDSLSCILRSWQG